MTTSMVAIEELPSFRDAAERARDLSIRFSSETAVRRTSNGWTVFVRDSVAIQLTPLKAPPSVAPDALRQSIATEHFDRGISEKQLLVLKAFYMGHEIAKKPSVINVALAMIDAAIEHLAESSQKPSTRWLAFYVMMRAEVMRHIGEAPVHLRERIRGLDQDMFDMHMIVEEGTQHRRKLEIESLAIVDPGIERIRRYTASNGWESWIVQYDIACRALGIAERDISASQRAFLSRSTLRDLLEEHGVPFAP